MIFVSIALLVIAGVLLLVGILSSSVPPLVCSVIATAAAGGVLWASFVHYRKEAVLGGAEVRGLGGNRRFEPGYPQAYAASPAGAAAANGHGPAPSSAPAQPAVPAGWDDMDDDDASSLVAAFNLDELHSLRRHEVEHERRKVVVDTIDERIDSIVELKRRVT